MPVRDAFAVVVSHDCEFNEGKRSHFLVARVRQVDPRMNLEELRAGNDYRARAQAGEPVAVDGFFLDPLPGAFDEPKVIDFCTITPFPMKVAEQLQQLKRAELMHEQRVLLREKVAAFFGRQAEDIPDDEKVPRPEMEA